ncbi:hypothetical protein STXM2123_1691 [Streptomyces sp. F-3]|nr:hypothetical protein STXM2123_1691 [Streptomyces sp. F-3]
MYDEHPQPVDNFPHPSAEAGMLALASFFGLRGLACIRW